VEKEEYQGVPRAVEAEVVVDGTSFITIEFADTIETITPITTATVTNNRIG